jgi:hypothetical protein
MERKIRETVSNFCLQKPSNISMPSYLNMDSSPVQVKPQTIKLVCVVSLLSKSI